MAGMRRMTLVLGMHRSGTSVLTGAIHRLGAVLGEALVPAAEDNPGGYFENAKAVDINEAFLLAIGSGWDDPEDFPPDWLECEASGQARESIRGLLMEEFADGPWAVLKDPRLCRLLPLWLPELRAAGFVVDVVLATRTPLAIIESLIKRDRMGRATAMLLTLSHWREAERGSRGLSRACVDYDAWVDAPERQLQRLASTLEWPVKHAAMFRDAVSLVDATQRHHFGARMQGQDAGLERLSEVACLLVDPIDESSMQGLDAIERPSIQSGSDDLGGVRWALLRERCRHRTLMTEVTKIRSALASVEQAALERLHQWQAMGQTLATTQTALAHAEGLSLARLEQLERMDRQLGDTQAALARVEVLSFERLSELEAHAAQAEQWCARATSLQLQLDEACREKAVRAADFSMLKTQHEALVTAHDAVLVSRSWRWTSPFRWLAAKLRSLLA